MRSPDRPRHHCFNPRAREERDALINAFSTPATCFNPRAREERDKCVIDLIFGVAQFQSTRSRGARPKMC